MKTEHPRSRPNLTIRQRSSRQAGFSLIEVVVAAGILTAVLIGVLGLMQLGARIARDQTGIAEMQQAHRSAQNYMVHHIRLAGRGGLPYSLPATTAPPAQAPQTALQSSNSGSTSSAKLVACWTRSISAWLDATTAPTHSRGSRDRCNDPLSQAQCPAFNRCSE